MEGGGGEARAEGNEFSYTVINQFIIKDMDNFHIIQIAALLSNKGKLAIIIRLDPFFEALILLTFLF